MCSMRMQQMAYGGRRAARARASSESFGMRRTFCREETSVANPRPRRMVPGWVILRGELSW